MNTHPADFASQAAVILEFLVDAFIAKAEAPPSAAPYSGEALEGLAGICMHLRDLCREVERAADDS